MLWGENSSITTEPQPPLGEQAGVLGIYGSDLKGYQVAFLSDSLDPTGSFPLSGSLHLRSLSLGLVLEQSSSAVTANARGAPVDRECA